MGSEMCIRDRFYWSNIQLNKPKMKKIFVSLLLKASDISVQAIIIDDDRLLGIASSTTGNENLSELSDLVLKHNNR